MKPQFVTAIYTDLAGTRFNGNPSAIYDRYKKSLRSLAEGGYSIVCYTSAAHYDELKEFYADLPNLKLVVEELSENYFHNQIEAIKDIDPKYTTDPSWRSRCVEIMWGKFYWLWKNTIHLDEDDYLFWIDAGIFHGGLLSKALKTSESTTEFDFDVITKKHDLHNGLVKFSGDKVLNIKCETVNHGSDDYIKVYVERPRFGVIGGVFGGKRDQVLEYITEMTANMQLVIDHNILLKEEEIMYYLYQRAPEKYTDFTFTSWYHEDWGIELYDPSKDTNLSDFFKKVISE